jgi:type I restriction enzyme S subunit
MKDSGVPWLGEVPEHWGLQRLDRLFDLRAEAPLDGDQRVTGYLDGRVTLRSNIAGQKIKGVVKEAGWQRVHPGDFAISGMNAHLGGMGVSDALGKCSPIYLVLKPKRHTNALFISHAVRRAAHSGALKALVNTIRFNSADFKRDDLKLILVPLPTKTEQGAIVRFVDHADRRIRRYIRAKLKLIKLLEEQRQVIIHRAVTRGLDPNVRLKPSGVEWLGEVPVHWEVAALRHRYSQCLGKMLDSKRITGRHSLPYLRNTDVQWDRINVVGLPRMDIAPAEYDRYTVEIGDLLVCEGGDVGRCALWSGQLDICGFQKALHRLRPQSEAEDVPRFLYYALRAAAKGAAFNDGHQSTIAHLTGDKLRAHRFAFPPSDEQAALVEHLDQILGILDHAVTATLAEITLLREYRARLISDVVTGKVDVREAAARLTEETEDMEPITEMDAPAEDNEDGEGPDLDAVAEV